MDSHKRVALDFDGVLANTMSKWVQLHNKYQNGSTNVTTNDIKRFDFWVDLGVTKEYSFNLFHTVWEDIVSIPPYEILGAKWAVEKMKEKAEVHVVTACLSKTINKWLAKYDIPLDTINYCGHDKSSLDYDIFIDDNPDLAQVIPDDKKLILYDQPWNQNLPFRKNINRIAMLEQAVKYIG